MCLLLKTDNKIILKKCKCQCLVYFMPWFPLHASTQGPNVWIWSLNKSVVGSFVSFVCFSPCPDSPMHPASQPANMPQCFSAPAWLVLWLPPSSSWLKLIIIVIKYQLFIRHRNSSYQGVPPHRLPLCGKEEEKTKRKGVKLTRQFSSQPTNQPTRDVHEP